MVSTDRPIQRVILPLDRNSDERHALLPATVLASWFGAKLQLVTPDPDAVGHYVDVAGGLGVPVDQVVALDSTDFASALAAHADSHAPSVCVSTADEAGFSLAKAIGQPMFLMGSHESHRLATGPLVVPISGTDVDLDALAVSAAWAAALELPVRLVIGSAPGSADRGTWAVRRLAEMNIASHVDTGGADEIRAAVPLAASRAATALVVGADQLDDDRLLDAAESFGVSLLVAPRLTDAGRQTIGAEDAEVGGGSDQLSGSQALGPEECADLLASEPVGRLGYVDGGWPVIVPVNFSVHESDVIIRGMPGAKLLAADRGDVVCFEVDSLDHEARTGWSVVVHGPLEAIADPRDLRSAWEHDPEPWADASSWRWLRIRPVSMTGRRYTASTAPALGH